MKKTKENAKRKKISAKDTFTCIVKSDMGVECVKEYQFHDKRKWRFDYAIPLYKIALEVEGGVWTGGRHVNPKGFLGDMEKYNTATLLGWRVLRTTPEQLYRLATLTMIRNTIEFIKKEKIHDK